MFLSLSQILEWNALAWLVKKLLCIIWSWTGTETWVKMSEKAAIMHPEEAWPNNLLTLGGLGVRQLLSFSLHCIRNTDSLTLDKIIQIPSCINTSEPRIKCSVKHQILQSDINPNNKCLVVITAAVSQRPADWLKRSRVYKYLPPHTKV